MPILALGPPDVMILLSLFALHEGEHRVALVVVQARFHVEDAVDEPDVQPARRHLELVVARNDDLQAVEPGLDHAGRLHGLVHALERDPRAAEPRHRPAVERVVDEFLHARGVQDRDHHVDEVEFGLVRGGGGFRRVIVAHQGDHAAVLRGAGEIGVAEHVAGTVDARALAVPHAEHAVVLALAAQFGLLRAPDGGRGEIFVQAGLEQDVVLVEMGLCPHELLVEPAERRAAIARNVSSRVQPRDPVALLLHQGRADQRLIAGDEHTALGEVIFVVERDVLQRHCAGLREGSLTRRLRCRQGHNVSNAQSRHQLAGIKASAMLTFRRWRVNFVWRWDASRKLHASAREEIWRNAADQAFALGRADTAAYQRRMCRQSSGIASLTIPVAMSVSTIAEMSAMV